MNLDSKSSIKIQPVNNGFFEAQILYLLLSRDLRDRTPGYTSGATKIVTLILGILLIISITGCATVSRRHTIDVFKQYNQITSELMFLEPDLETDNPDGFASLAAAEQQMHEACQPLNDLAVAHMEGANPGFLQKLRAARVVDACEKETRQVDVILNEVTP